MADYYTPYTPSSNQTALNYITDTLQTASDLVSNTSSSILDNIIMTGDSIQDAFWSDLLNRLPWVGQPLSRFKDNIFSKTYAYALANQKTPSPALLDYFNSTYGDLFNDNFYQALEKYNRTSLYPSQYEWYKYHKLQRDQLPFSTKDIIKMLKTRNYTNLTNYFIDKQASRFDPVRAYNYIVNKVRTDLAKPKKPYNLRGSRPAFIKRAYNTLLSYFTRDNTNPHPQVIAPNIPVPINNTTIPTVIANDTNKFNSFLNQLINNNNTKIINSNMDATPGQPTFYTDINPYTYPSVRSAPTDYYYDYSYYRPLSSHQKRRLSYKYGLINNYSNKNDTQQMVIYGRNKFPLTRYLNRRRQRARRTQMRRYKTVNSSDSYIFDCYKMYNVNGPYGLDGTNFSASWCIRDLLGQCVLWPQTAALYNQFKVTYFTIEFRQLLAYRYYINQPVIAINCLYNANASSSFTYEDVRSSTGAMVYHMEKNYFVYKHRFNFTQSPSPGLGKFTDLDKGSTSTYLEPHDADTYIFARSNLPFKFDLTGLPGSDTDDVTETTPLFEVHFKFWVKLKGKMQ